MPALLYISECWSLQNIFLGLPWVCLDLFCSRLRLVTGGWEKEKWEAISPFYLLLAASLAIVVSLPYLQKPPHISCPKRTTIWNNSIYHLWSSILHWIFLSFLPFKPGTNTRIRGLLTTNRNLPPSCWFQHPESSICSWTSAFVHSVPGRGWLLTVPKVQLLYSLLLCLFKHVSSYYIPSTEWPCMASICLIRPCVLKTHLCSANYFPFSNLSSS